MSVYFSFIHISETLVYTIEKQSLAWRPEGINTVELLDQDVKSLVTRLSRNL